MYACGLTVYARGHIGNFRTFICLDVLRRTLKYVAGFRLHQVINFTDVDDKTIAASNDAGISLHEYTDRYIAAFHEDSASLGLEAAEEYPRATDEVNLRSMVDAVKALEARGHTYESEGSIYYKISTLPEYGKLARLDHEGIQPGARIDSDQYAKQDARDFVLWKASAPGEPSWDFGIGPGRPGWHIECSSMALRLLGEGPIDIHAGGVDLIFPHHENEIAQAEGATGKPFARFWVHVEHLLLDRSGKMSKSVGNVFTVKDVLDQGHRASALRYVLMSTHYRKQLRFTWESLMQAEEALTRLMDCLRRVEVIAKDSVSKTSFRDRIEAARSNFTKLLLDDLNTPGAVGVVFEFVRDVNSAIDAGLMGAQDASEVLTTFDWFDQVLGVIRLRRLEEATPPLPLEEIERLMEDRRMARARREFSTADEIRQNLEDRGIVLEDSANGTRWKRK